VTARKSTLRTPGSDFMIIPELEEIAATYQPKGIWTPEDVAVLRTYYGRVPTSKLAVYLKRKHSSITNKAQELGLSVREAQGR